MSVLSSSLRFRMSMASKGQTLMQIPQPMQSSSEMSAILFVAEHDALLAVDVDRALLDALEPALLRLAEVASRRPQPCGPISDPSAPPIRRLGWGRRSRLPGRRPATGSPAVPRSSSTPRPPSSLAHAGQMNRLVLHDDREEPASDAERLHECRRSHGAHKSWRPRLSPAAQKDRTRPHDSRRTGTAASATTALADTGPPPSPSRPSPDRRSTPCVPLRNGRKD